MNQDTDVLARLAELEIQVRLLKDTISQLSVTNTRLRECLRAGVELATGQRDEKVMPRFRFIYDGTYAPCTLQGRFLEYARKELER